MSATSFETGFNAGLAAGLLVTKLVIGGPGPLVPPPLVEAYFADVRRVIEALPHQYGPWLGADVPPNPAAVEMLQPNKLFGRRYVNAETGASFSLLITHCDDVRDMIGHYPALGAGQLQVVMSLQLPEAQRREITEMAFAMIDDVLRRVAGGVR